VGAVRADLTGRRFGRLVVCEQVPSEKSGGTTRRRWHCRCDCGGENVVTTDRLTAGKTRSCGCLAREMAVERRRLFDEARVLGFETSSPSFSWWRGAVLRATVAVTDCAAVQIDQRWLGPGGYGRFLADMGEATPGTQLVRVDRDAPYSKTNCLWTCAGRLQGVA
jgi:hypothetical protein